MSDKDKIINGGLYRHYKGRFYRVLGLAIHSETEESLVIYHGINKITNQVDLFARPCIMWLEDVDGKPRFEKVENENSAEVIDFFEKMGQKL